MESLQDRYAPNSICYGCGPANKQGLRIKSRVEGDEVVADWTPDPFHHAFEGILNGGIIALVLDCHSNWTAVYHIMKENTGDAIPGTVTSDFCIRFIHPTPMGRTIRLRAKVVEVKKDRASVKASLEVENRATALFQGTFVAVKEGHPAFSRWR